MIFGCIVLVAVIIFFWTTGQRYKVFNEKSLRPPGPLVTDKKQRDDRLKKGEENSHFKHHFNAITSQLMTSYTLVQTSRIKIGHKMNYTKQQACIITNK